MSQVFESFIYGLIVLNVFTFLLNTVDAITKHSAVDQLLDGIEAVSVVIFTLEYLARFAAAGTQGQGIDNGAEVLYRGAFGKLR